MQEIRLQLLSGTDSAITQKKVIPDSHIRLASQEHKLPNPFSVKQWKGSGISPLRDRMMMEWVIHHKEVMKILHSITAEMDVAFANLERKLESRSKNPKDVFTVAVTCSTGRGLSPCIVECLQDYYNKTPPIDNLVVTTEHMDALHVPSASRDRLVWQQLPTLSAINPLRSHHSSGIFQIVRTVISPDWVDLPMEISSQVEAAFERKPLSNSVRVKDLVLDFRSGSMYSKTTSQQFLLRCSLLPQPCTVDVRLLQHETYKPFVSSFRSAGIFPYSFHPISGEAIFLVGHITYGSCTWCDFGGLKSLKIFSHRLKETPAEAAARECAEETMGVLGTKEHLLGSLRKYKENNAFKVINEDTHYVGHLLWVPFDHYPAMFGWMVMQQLANDCEVEVNEMRWLPLSSMKKAVQLVRSTTKHVVAQPIRERDGSLDEEVFLPLREEFAGSLCIAAELGFLDCIGHLAQLRRKAANSSLLDQLSEPFRKLVKSVHEEPKNPSSGHRMTNTVDELRILQLDAKGKGSSMPGPHSDEQWRCGDQQRLAQQQHDSESDCSDYESGTTESDADEDAGDILVERYMEERGTIQSNSQGLQIVNDPFRIDSPILIPSLEATRDFPKQMPVISVSSNKRKKQKKGRKSTHSSKARGRVQFLQYGMGAGRLHYDPECFFSV